MATRPLPEPAEPPSAPYAQEYTRDYAREYIKEVHEFFATSHVPFGAPEDLPGITARLAVPGTFADDLSSLVRSMVLRQGGAMPHAELLEILAAAIAGPEMVRSPQLYQEQLRQLLGFVSGVMRRPWNVPPNVSAEVVPFPTDAAAEATESLTPPAVVANGADPQGVEDSDGVEAGQPTPRQPIPTLQAADRQTPASPTQAPPIPIRSASAIGAALAEKRVESFHAAEEPSLHNTLRLPDSNTDSVSDPIPPLAASATTQGQPSKPRRRVPVALAATAVVALAVVAAALVLRAHPSGEDSSTQAVPAAASSASPGQNSASPAHPAAPVASGVSRPLTLDQSAPGSALANGSASGPNAQSEVQPGSQLKPSPYGYAAAPPRHKQPPVSARGYSDPVRRSTSQTAAPRWASNNPSSQPAYPARTSGSTRAAVASSSEPPTTYVPYPQQSSNPSPAPIIRLPPADPDAYIVGEMPPGTRPQQPQYAQPAYFTVSSGVMAANLISAPSPEYPAFARLAHIQGQVILQAVVATDGTVSATHVLRGNPLLRGAAQEAVRRWRYRPYRIGGRPVDVATIVTVDFHDHS
jgi:TonB family protein